MAFYGVPVILKEGTKTESGNKALYNNISAVNAISEAVKSTFGPHGLSKMIVDSFGDANVTNDSFSILDELEVQHPAAKMTIQLSKSMNKDIGDGVTKTIIIAGELLKIGKDLLEQKIHPNTIISGFGKALKKVMEFLDNNSKKIDIKNEVELKKVALTTLNSKLTYGANEKLAEIAVNSIKKIIEYRGNKNYADLDLIQIIKKEGDQLQKSDIFDGIIVDKEVVSSTMPKVIKDARIALINQSLEIKKTEFDTDIKITDPSQINAFKLQEDNTIKNLIQNIIDSGANVVFCQKGIDDLAQHYLAESGIMAIRRVKRSDLTKLMKSTGAKIMGEIKSLSKHDLGVAEKVEERYIGKDKMIFVEKCQDEKSTSILLRAGTRHILEDAERSLKNVLGAVRSVVEDGYIVPGAGAIEIELSKNIRQYAKTISSKESISINAYADALEKIPLVLADNAGLNTIDIMAQLLAKHEEPNGKNMGIDLRNNQIVDAYEINIIEPKILIKHAISSATELCLMFLRVDEIISSSLGGSGPVTPGPEHEVED